MKRRTRVFAGLAVVAGRVAIYCSLGAVVNVEFSLAMEKLAYARAALMWGSRQRRASEQRLCLLELPGDTVEVRRIRRLVKRDPVRDMAEDAAADRLTDRAFARGLQWRSTTAQKSEAA
jgi:hypothetical protein